MPAARAAEISSRPRGRPDHRAGKAVSTPAPFRFCPSRVPVTRYTACILDPEEKRDEWSEPDAVRPRFGSV